MKVISILNNIYEIISDRHDYENYKLSDMQVNDLTVISKVVMKKVS